MLWLMIRAQNGESFVSKYSNAGKIEYECPSSTKSSVIY